MLKEKFYDYTIDGLVKEFERHSEIYKKDCSQFKDTFSVSKALHVICKEIQELKRNKSDG